MFQLFPTEFEQIGGNNGQWWETGRVCVASWRVASLSAATIDVQLK